MTKEIIFTPTNKKMGNIKIVGKLVEGIKKITSGNYVDEICSIYKIENNQYKLYKVEYGKIIAEVDCIYMAKDFIEIGRESAYSASRSGLLQYKLA